MSRERLTKLLGMLGSEFDGERANAAAMIAKMAKEQKKSIADLVMGGGERIVYLDRIVYRDRIVEKVVYRDRPTMKIDPDEVVFKDGLEPTWKRRRPRAGGGSVLAQLREINMDYPEQLTGYEMEFIDNVLAKCEYDYELSDKQLKVARRIISKALGEPLI